MHPQLTAGVRRFQRDVHPARAALFERLATTHRPGALFIGCSDARVAPELLTQSEPGELFVIRTAGNLVPAYGPRPDAVTATIEYALTALGVTDVIVCGHSGCGAMTALATGEGLAGLPALAGWLDAAGPDGDRARAAAGTTEARIAALVRDNVATQLARLATHPSVARALARDAVTLHGWTHDIRTGAVDVLDPRGATFTPLS
ncbi:carbonic anhydrase [Streptomyces albofaciens JCM 4342]|uniref:carbonic anhydrase n=1 Tax=Streptomyces albofaciens TaxID=66866 RepID=UPI001238F22C|nr:carbonic anhydrase [Streptomyces albofaciens]KAA6213410.1 carbonic anhydrase [Streptomyces albofaciens JCM 4342]